MTTYLLPCSCGGRVPVEPRHAGQQLHCACGRTLTAPTLLEITRLEPAPPLANARAAAPAWGTAQRLVTIGLVILVLGLGWGAFVLVTRPQPPTTGLTSEFIDRNIGGMTPQQCFGLWSNFAQNGIDPSKTRADKAYEAAYARFLMVLGLAVVVMVIGGSLVAVGVGAARRAS